MAGGRVRAKVSRHRPAVALVSWHTSPLARPGAGSAGGMNVYVREVAAALAATGVRVDILSAAPRAASVALAEGVRLLAVPPASLAGAALPRYDVVHSHYWQSAAPARLLVERSRARHVHTFHTLGEVKNAARGPGERPESADRLRIESALLREVDAVIVATAAERAQTMSVARGRPAPVHVVAPGVDTRRFRPAGERASSTRAVRARLGLDDVPTVVHVGRIQPLKAVDVAVRALAGLGGGREGRARLLLAGGPSGPAGPEALAAIGAAARQLPRGVGVRRLGTVSRAALPALLAACDLAVVPSRSESFCLAALEAQASGLPVVGTAVGGLPEFVANGASGFLAAGAPGPFSARIGELLGSASLRSRMAQTAVESARRYAWSTAAAAIREIYAL